MKTSKEFGGTGLGLAITKNLVFMKGKIAADNRPEGGAAIYLLLPLPRPRLLLPAAKATCAGQKKMIWPR